MEKLKTIEIEYQNGFIERKQVNGLWSYEKILKYYNMNRKFTVDCNGKTVETKIRSVNFMPE